MRGRFGVASSTALFMLGSAATLYEAARGDVLLTVTFGAGTAGAMVFAFRAVMHEVADRLISERPAGPLIDSEYGARRSHRPR